MEYKLFLDDVRTMTDCVTYMHSRIGSRNPVYLEKGWVICRNYECFKSTILEYGLPTFVSFDHDLQSYPTSIQEAEYADRYGYREQTGQDCAKWLIEYCMDHDFEIPEFAVHSMNPVGGERIFSLLTQAKRGLHDRIKDSNRERI